jgi:hypothetical protein
MFAAGFLIPAPTPTRAASPCAAGYAILGQTPALTGATPTDWFNVTGENFDPSVVPTMAFSVPVIPWAETNPMIVEAAVTTFTVPGVQDAMLGFKWTFRSAATGIQRISVRVAGKGCAATTLVDFAAPATSTTLEALDRASIGLDRLLAMLLAFVLGGLASLRRTRHA